MRRLFAAALILAAVTASAQEMIWGGGGGLTQGLADTLYCQLVGCTMTGTITAPNIKQLDTLTVQGGLAALAATSSGESAEFHSNTLWTHTGAFALLYPNIFQTRIAGPGGTGQITGLRIFTDVEPTVTSSMGAVGLLNEVEQLSTAGGTGVLTATNSAATHRGSGTISSAIGTNSLAQISGATGTITNAYSFFSGLSASTSGTITRGFGLRVATPSVSGTGSIGSFAGVSINNPTVATNNSCLVLGATTTTLPTGNFAIYSYDTDPSVFSGPLGTAAIGVPRLYVDYTNTATVGAVVINKAAGRVRIAAAGTSVVVTNSVVTAASHVFVSVSTDDATAVLKNVVPAAGSFTITTTAAVTAETTFDFFIVNAD